jgi:tetratricopeptide (TPR) repeat protein
MTAAWRSFAISTLSLGSFFWGIYRMPLPGSSGTQMDAEESRQLRDEVALACRMGRWQHALKPALRLHAAYPGEPVYMASLGETYSRLERYREAAQIWSEYLDHSPTPIEGCPQAPQSYEKLGAHAEAIRLFERCLSFEPDNPDSLYYLAHALESSNQIGRAEELYLRGVAVRPDNPDLQIGLARIRLRQGRPEEARGLAAAVLERQAGNVDALLVMGLASRRLGDRARAKAYLTRGAGLAPRDGDFVLSLAQMAEEDADVQAAIGFYERAAALDQANPELARKLATLKRVAE